MIYTAKVVGYLVYLDKSYPEEELLSYTYTYIPPLKKTLKKYAPIYVKHRATGDKIIGLGAFRFIYKESPLLFNLISGSSDFSSLYELPYPENLTLRSYQKDCLDLMMDSKGGVIRLPTGAGKGTIEVAYAYQALSLGHVVLLVPTQAAQQTMLERCKQYGIPSLSYSECRDSTLNKNHVIVTIPNSLANDSNTGRNYLIRIGVTTVIADECHHLQAKTWQAVFYGLPKVQRSFGFSATLTEQSTRLKDMSLDNSLMISYTGPVIYSKSAKDPEVAKFLDIPDLYEIDYFWENKITTTSWEDIATEVENNKDRQSYIASIVNIVCKLGYTCLSVVSRKAVANLQYNYLDHSSALWFGGGDLSFKKENTELKGGFAYGNVTSKEETAFSFVKDNLRTSIKSIVATNHVNEAVDLPNLDVVILSENVNPKVVIQRAGRTTRPGDKKSIVINLYDKNGGVLESHSRKRMYHLQREFGVFSKKVTLNQLEIILK